MQPVTVRVKNLATGAPARWGKGEQPLTIRVNQVAGHNSPRPAR